MRAKKNIVELTLMSAEEALAAPKAPVSVMLDNVRSLHNVGSIFRTADALGLREVVLCGITGRPPHPELEKTALGAERSVNWRHVADAEQECRRLREKGKLVAVLEQTHDSIPLQQFRVPEGKEVVLVVGNEVEGVSQTVVSMADVVLEIPQRGAKHSLNVSVSAGMALWQLTAPFLAPHPSQHEVQ